MNNLLDSAIVYDVETFPSAFTFHMEGLNSNQSGTWQISEYRDDRQSLLEWFQWWAQNQTLMIGFNSINFDYPIVHYIYSNPFCTVADIYSKAMQIIEGNDRFAHTIWANKRFAPQADLFKIFHMDNPAKSTSLKALQINMRAPFVLDMPIKVGSFLTEDQINNVLIPYNQHDVRETKRFAQFSLDAINFRVSQINDFGIDVLNWADTKIGSKIMEDRLGDELCYDRSSGKRMTRQTVRTRIALADIIFPYIYFENPEFQRVLEYLKAQVLTSDEIGAFGENTPAIKTKGVFIDLKAHVGGIDFYFGTGGIHGSVSSQRIEADDDNLLRDIDVQQLYPQIAIVNRLFPEHLGYRFTEVYSELPKERKRWQKEKGKKCTEANTLKLASNGVYGNSNNRYSPFYDPQFTLTITFNGQLMLCMLAEKLANVPTLKIVQINTDGITYYINKEYEPMAAEICRQWEKYTMLVLEDVEYSRLWIRDVNNYIAEGKDGSLKTKGVYWTPDPLDYHNSIGSSQPPAWHKDLSNVVSVRAAVAAMVHNVPPETYIRMCTNPYDFMCRIKTRKADDLLHGGKPVQKTSRYYISTDGMDLVKTSPPMGTPGMYKKANGVSDFEYARVMQETNNQWDERVCTKNQSKYEERNTAIAAGYKTTICNDVKDFRFDNINYDWYISEAKKLIV